MILVLQDGMNFYWTEPKTLKAKHTTAFDVMNDQDLKGAQRAREEMTKALKAQYPDEEILYQTP